MKEVGKKVETLIKEGVKVKNGRIVDFEKRYFEINPELDLLFLNPSGP